MDIYLTNNLTNKKEQFVPKSENKVGIYVCGPTVYDDPHIGNARPLVIFDILFKLLKNEFPSVQYVRNITDIDDKIIKSSQEQKISTKELTGKITKEFLDDCKFLNCILLVSFYFKALSSEQGQIMAEQGFRPPHRNARIK